MSDETPVTPLTTRGRVIRVMITLAATGLLLAGTFWGEDDHFPFGPFKMYASAVDPDAPTIDTRLEGTDAAGEVVILTEQNTGIRRAEIEGQMDRIAREPELLEVAADAYDQRNPQAPRMREVRIVVRWYAVRDFQPTGEYEEDIVAVWGR